MSKLRIVGERKARSVPLSLRPKHQLMLAELEAILSTNKSKIVQQLIEEAYIKKFPQAHGQVATATDIQLNLFEENNV